VLAPWLVAGVVWLGVGLSVGAWGLRWMGRGPLVAEPVAAVPALEVDAAAVARALGEKAPTPAAVAPMPDAASRLVLRGVVAAAPQGAAHGGGMASSGVALIAVDGQRARPYRVGAVVDGRWRVASVGRGTVVLDTAEGAASSVTLPVKARVPGQPTSAAAP
jgi:general secretion pathway protein C